MGQVSDILGAKGRDVLGIEGSATVYEAIAKMVEGNVGALLVYDNDRLAGIVTERDYLRRVHAPGPGRAHDAGAGDHDVASSSTSAPRRRSTSAWP